MFILDNVRDNKLMQLYLALTKSDLQGNYEDTYLIELLFTVLVIDLIVNQGNPTDMKAKDIVNLAKEIVRIFETPDGELSYYSVRNWTESVLEYMADKNKDYKDIHKMNTYDLREEVSAYLKKGDE